MWYWFDNVKKVLTRTDNTAEAWHSILHELLVSARENIWKLIDATKTYESMHNIVILQQQGRNMSYRYKEKSYVDYVKRLKSAVKVYSKFDYLYEIEIACNTD